MLMVRSRSSRTGGTGKISSRTVPKIPRISQRSPCFSSAPIFDLVFDMVVLFAVVAEAVHAIDPREHFSHSGKQLSRNLATHLPVLEEHASQRFILHDGHVVLAGNFTDLQGVQARTFRNDLWRFHALPVVAERDSQVRRVG